LWKYHLEKSLLVRQPTARKSRNELATIMESVMLMDDGYKMSAREVQDEWDNDIRM
jgi:hypothetical protein